MYANVQIISSIKNNIYEKSLIKYYFLLENRLIFLVFSQHIANLYRFWSNKLLP